MLYTFISAVIPWLLVGVGAWLLFEMLRLCGRVLLRLDAIDEQLKTAFSRPAAPVAPVAEPQSPPARPPGLSVGGAAPAFELVDLAGVPHSLAEFLGRRILLIFFNPQCGHCQRLAESLAALDVEVPENLPRPVIVTTGSLDDNRAMVEKYGLKCPLLLQTQAEVSSRYLATGTPMAYVIDAGGNLASPLTIGTDAVMALASGQIPASNPPSGALPDLPPGSAAPGFELPDLAGQQRSLVEFRGRRVVVIFFSPHCGFCTRMADDLARLSMPLGDVVPLLISAGSEGDNRSMVDEYGLHCPLLLQGQSLVSSDYRCGGTPMGYLIDESGNIASAKAAGADALLALCRPANPVVEASSLADSLIGKSPNPEKRPCAKCHGSKVPCPSCEDNKVAALGHTTAEVEAQPYGLVQLRSADGVDAMVEDLLRSSNISLRLFIIHGDDGSNGMSSTESAALRRFLRQRPDWMVLYQPTDATRFLVLSRDPRDRKTLPSILTKAANFARALSLHVADGASKVTAEQMEQRLEICTLCDRRSGDHCSACGCDLPTKAGWRTTFCPLSKWPALEKSQVL